jgi:dCTP deaminase
MFLSDRDLRLALEANLLVVEPPPAQIDTCAIDLHLDRVDEAKVWDMEKYGRERGVHGDPTYLRIGTFRYRDFAPRYLIPIPVKSAASGTGPYRDGDLVILPPHGFLLWQTKEVVGTPEEHARFVCFIEGKSSRARTGLLIHMTAPIIHANWHGQVTLEIGNLGPFSIGLKEGDAVAQLVVASLTSPPLERKIEGSVAVGQRNVSGGTAPNPRS